MLKTMNARKLLTGSVVALAILSLAFPVTTYANISVKKNVGSSKSLTSQVASKVVVPSANDVIAALSPRLAYITCNWYNRYGNILFSKTSNGLLGPRSSNGSYFVSTVQGGVIDTAYAGYMSAPSTCTISFPAGASLYGGGQSTLTTGSYGSGTSPVNIANQNIDFAQVSVNIPNNYLALYAKKTFNCSKRPVTGDAVQVLGWPAGVRGQTLTGAITGIFGYYDMTNIMVPDGMQGSTAVLSSSGCVLGQINASGQIVDYAQIAYLFAW